MRPCAITLRTTCIANASIPDTEEQSRCPIGLYAMVSIAVGQHRREIGIRVALGAHHRQVVMMFFRSGVRVIMIGLALGLPNSPAGLAMMAILMEIPWILLPQSALFVTLGVVGVGPLASWLPARRTASVDPTVALRAE